MVASWWDISFDYVWQSKNTRSFRKIVHLLDAKLTNCALSRQTYASLNQFCGQFWIMDRMEQEARSFASGTDVRGGKKSL